VTPKNSGPQGGLAIKGKVTVSSLVSTRDRLGGTCPVPGCQTVWLVVVLYFPLLSAVRYRRRRASLEGADICQAAGLSPAEADSPFNEGALRAGLFEDDGSPSGTLVQIPGPVCLHFTIFSGLIILISGMSGERRGRYRVFNRKPIADGRLCQSGIRSICSRTPSVARRTALTVSNN
jgi:hypothetical protein